MRTKFFRRQRRVSPEDVSLQCGGVGVPDEQFRFGDMADLQDIRLFLDLEDEVEEVEGSADPPELVPTVGPPETSFLPTAVAQPLVATRDAPIPLRTPGDLLTSAKHQPYQRGWAKQQKESKALKADWNPLGDWNWYRLDGYSLPSVLRQGVEYLAVQMVQLGLLVQYTFVLPDAVVARHKMPSLKMTPREAHLLNTVNAHHCHFRFGFDPLRPGDELVLASHAERFYWTVKTFNLQKMLESYDRQITLSPQVLLGHIRYLRYGCLKKLRAAELEAYVRT